MCLKQAFHTLQVILFLERKKTQKVFKRKKGYAGHKNDFWFHPTVFIKQDPIGYLPEKTRRPNEKT